jgi:hypothetical protein
VQDLGTRSGEPVGVRGWRAVEEGAPVGLCRENDRVWIDGLPTLEWGRPGECTYAGALATALAVTDHPATYTEIMGWSGLAFRVRWYRDGCCPSSAVGEFPEELEATRRATGWELPCIDNWDGRRGPGMTSVAPDVVRSIEAGVPLIGYPTSNELDVAVLYGYERDGAAFLWRAFFSWGSEEPKVIPAAEAGPLLWLLGSWTQPVDGPRERFLTALRLAVHHWDRGDDDLTSQASRYHYGGAAFDAWQAALEAPDADPEGDHAHLFRVNWWSFLALGDARTHAVHYLEASRRHAGAAAEELIRAAIGFYQRESQALLRQFGLKEAFFGPWSGKNLSDWNAEVRDGERRILRECRAFEEEAVPLLAEALSVAERDQDDGDER